MASSAADDSDRDVKTLAEELARRWTPDFTIRDWPGRLQLLNEVHEQLLEDLGDLNLYSAVSPAFIRKLIENLPGGGPVTSIAQAHIFANSEDEEHRRAAGEWLEHHKTGPTTPLAQR
jgi:hypothetical protein